MLQVARLAPCLLGDAAALVEGYLRGQQNDDGGFNDREGKSDLYYTAFGLQGLAALSVDLPTEPVEEYLRGFGDGEGLDSVHVACLARCWSAIRPGGVDGPLVDSLLGRIEQGRTPDGGYHIDLESQQGDIYGCFMALGAYEDLGRLPPEPERVVRCVAALRTSDGGYSNEPGTQVGLTPSSAAAAVINRRLGGVASDPELELWLLRQLHPDGGFYAARGALYPDLLSTATALHALAGMHSDLGPLKEASLDFIDTLWTARGGFHGHWEDDDLDCEYTYYGLLALGHLSL
ncbi:Prenyltransferase and squalene oxidase repeat protein [Posidoniimonas polymericola]|uniref:Prenyltransferase and squalene oxidase repeat protein n=1 Tax=Posidoniimonas polymericola TaxID=2528002 RepID=A0A5C5YLI9_9BACT|nr:prenyltransferase/squalene oxidase repeat-containing protein [Posidoniimonas polymericola]TWT75669.1 Prenyltransferase and squalene oxidase repeat protein [Posidoniimonas polymericola]